MGFSSFFPYIFLICSLLPSIDYYYKAEAFTGTYGVNYGRVADNLPPPENVVTLLKSSKIKNVRIYDANHDVLNAFKGSGIEIVTCIPNENLEQISMDSNQAMNWVLTNVNQFLPGTSITGIAMGNEILGTDTKNSQFLLPAAQNVYNALVALNLSKKVLVQTAHSEGVFAISYPPSSGKFKEDVLQYMLPLLKFFSEIGSPFFINAYPFLAYKSDPQHIDLNYAIFEKNPGIYDEETKIHYDNMFDAQVDAAYAALEKAGFGEMEVIVSETGWASNGDVNEIGANLKNARIYNYNLRKKLAKRKRTPYRPKIPTKAYVFGLFNEDLKPGPTSERNFGLFKHDGSVAYDVGFKGLVPSDAFKNIGGTCW